MTGREGGSWWLALDLLTPSSLSLRRPGQSGGGVVVEEFLGQQLRVRAGQALQLGSTHRGGEGVVESGAKANDYLHRALGDHYHATTQVPASSGVGCSCVCPSWRRRLLLLTACLPAWLCCDGVCVMVGV